MHRKYSEVASCNTYVKVASCNPHGELLLSPSVLGELILEQKYSLEHMSSTFHGASQAIAFAAFCRENGQERTAISSLKDIWHGIHLSSSISQAHLETLKEQILHEVSLLWHSPDDCVWEEASQFL